MSEIGSLTLNLRSPIGALPYGMPRNAKYGIPLKSVSNRFPRTLPFFVAIILYKFVSTDVGDSIGR